MPSTLATMNSLKGKTWATLQRIAVEAGIPLYKIREAPTRDALRLLIVDAEVDRALGEGRR